MPYTYFKDTPKRVVKVKKKSRKQAKESRLRAKKKGHGVSKVKFSWR